MGSNVKYYTAEQVRLMVLPSEWDLVKSWSADGRTVGVYQNLDPGHRDVGRVKVVSLDSSRGEVLSEVGNDDDDFRYDLIGLCDPSVVPLRSAPARNIRPLSGGNPGTAIQRRAAGRNYSGIR